MGQLVSYEKQLLVVLVLSLIHISVGFGIDAAICELNQKQRQAVLESNGIKKASYLTPILKAFRAVSYTHLLAQAEMLVVIVLSETIS